MRAPSSPLSLRKSDCRITNTNALRQLPSFHPPSFLFKSRLFLQGLWEAYWQKKEPYGPYSNDVYKFSMFFLCFWNLAFTENFLQVKLPSLLRRYSSPTLDVLSICILKNSRCSMIRHIFTGSFWKRHKHGAFKHAMVHQLAILADVTITRKVI